MHHNGRPISSQKPRLLLSLPTLHYITFVLFPVLLQLTAKIKVQENLS